MIDMRKLKDTYNELFTNDWDHSSLRLMKDLISIASFFIDSATPQKILCDLNRLRIAVLQIEIEENMSKKREYRFPDYYRCSVEGIGGNTPFTFAPTINFYEKETEMVAVDDKKYINEVVESIKDVDFSSLIIFINQRKNEVLGEE